MKQAASMAIEAHRQDEFRDLLERHRAIVFKVANTYGQQPDDRAELPRRSPRSCGARSPATTRNARYPPGCTASR